MVYFAQFNLKADAVAMVTASHNENGWTGVKMGIKRGLTHAPEEMKELKEITLNQNFSKGEGNEKQINNFDKIYKDDLINNYNKQNERDISKTYEFTNWDKVEEFAHEIKKITL